MIWKQNQKIRFFSTACPLSNWTILLGYQTKRTQTSKTLVNIVVQNFWISLQILPPNSSAGCFLRSWHKERSAKKPKNQKVKYLLSKVAIWAEQGEKYLYCLNLMKENGHHLLVPPSKVAVPAKYPHLRRISNICWVAECKPRLLTLSFHHMWSFELGRVVLAYFCKAIFEKKKVGVTLATFKPFK